MVGKTPTHHRSIILNSRNILVWPLLGLSAFLAQITHAQSAAGAPAPAAQPPVAYASVSELNGILTNLQQTAKNIQSDLVNMRIEKWKTNNSTKQQTLGNVDSIQRNLQSALPEIIAGLNSAPRTW